MCSNKRNAIREERYQQTSKIVIIIIKRSYLPQTQILSSLRRIIIIFRYAFDIT